MTEFRGIIPPVLTPFTPSGELDLPSLDRLVDHLVDAGVDGLFALGSSGQVAYLTDAQRGTVVRRIVARTAGRVPVVVGTADLTAPRVIEQGRAAVAAGASGIVVTAPLYAINDAAEIGRHFRMIAAGVGAPVLAYDVPVRVHTKLGVGMLLELARDGVIVSVKDSSGDDVAFRRLVAANADAGRPMTLLSGHELMLDGMFLLGGDGGVPGLANVDPAGYVRLWRAAQAGDWVAARAEQDRLARLFDIVFVPQGRSGDAGGIGAFKAALALLGVIDSASMPAPLEGLSASDVDAIGAILREVGLL
ncbi:dihydrodipicolinate synthase family protein [Propioniciclava tarda]|uniref:Dihydrodipicolinate synthase family protein n=1 Tax=Propioniciclava tarda TaxID=433330 RepID=A0A4Q9KNX0_PROTD|nr:dihydrodipicolinate synthase family protein [Propioniciclava tarda]TBT96184.1 dihydrodipicolinate synthase family protein [Propioniciclava tarda]SMO32918.1 4-hydroxy-tetrahydrodipicolinate synthase [Propioniciclava tarda]